MCFLHILVNVSDFLEYLGLIETKGLVRNRFAFLASRLKKGHNMAIQENEIMVSK